MMGTCTRQCFTTRAQSLRRSAMEDGVSQIRARNRRWVDHQSTPYDRIMQGQMYPWSVLSSSCFQVGAVLSARSSPCFPGLHLYGAFSGSMIYIFILYYHHVQGKRAASTSVAGKASSAWKFSCRRFRTFSYTVEGINP